jgi:hypothetical protein
MGNDSRLSLVARQKDYALRNDRTSHCSSHTIYEGESWKLKSQKYYQGEEWNCLEGSYYISK